MLYDRRSLLTGLEIGTGIATAGRELDLVRQRLLLARKLAGK